MIRSFTALAFALAMTAPAAAETPAPQASPATAPAAPATATTAATRPLEDFAALPFMSAPQISPDGSKIAARIATHGKQIFAVYPVDSSKGQPILIPTGTKSDLNWWRWVGNDWLAIGVGAMAVADGGVEMYITRTLGLSADGRLTKQIAFDEAGQNAGEMLWSASDGTPRILLAIQKSVYLNMPGFWPQVVEADLSTGRTRNVQMPIEGVSDWYADAAGTVRMGIGYRDLSRSGRLLYRDKAGEYLRTIDRAKFRDGEELIVPALFLAEPGKAVAYDDSSGFTTLRELDLATLTLGRTIHASKGFDIDGIVTNATRDGVAGVELHEDRQSVHWIDPDLATVQAEMDKAIGANRHARIVSMDKARNRLLVLVDAPDMPGSYYVFDRASGRMSRFAHVNEAFGHNRGHPVRTIRFKARDGVEIAAVVTLPRGRDAKALPVIIMPHGGPAARNSEGWGWWAQFLADRGYAVIQPNFRGSSGYGEAFAKLGEGAWGLAMQDDLNDALAWAAKEGIADPKRACMVGGSYGGYAAMRAAQRDGALYRCAISFAGVSNLNAMKQYDRRFLNSGRRGDWLAKQAPDLQSVSPVNFADQISIPILLIHGKEDQRVPVRQSRELAAKLRKAGKPMRYIEQPLGDHHLSRQEDRTQFLREMEAFLKVHNPAS